MRYAVLLIVVLTLASGCHGGPLCELCKKGATIPVDAFHSLKEADFTAIQTYVSSVSLTAWIGSAAAACKSLGTAGMALGAKVAGFGSAGVAQGSLAAGWQASIGNVAAGSTFAFLQSVGATALAGSTACVAGGAVACGATCAALCALDY